MFWAVQKFAITTLIKYFYSVLVENVLNQSLVGTTKILHPNLARLLREPSRFMLIRGRLSPNTLKLHSET